MWSKFLLAATAFVGALAIYPDDHWDFATKLTSDNYDSTIQQSIDAGKTLFIRWIASPG